MIPSHTVQRASLTKRLSALGAAAVIVLAACGDDDDASSTTVAAASSDAAAPETTVAPSEAATTTAAGGKGDYGDSATTTPESATAPAAGGDASLLVGDTSLGPVLTDATGLTLYIFMPDNAGAPTCVEGCAANWPPALVDGAATAGDGVDAAMLSTVANPEGGTQITYNSWPLYTFANDAAPGDVNGQGQGDVWYAMGTDGNPIDDD